MAKHTIYMQTALLKKLTDVFDGYTDDKIQSCTFVKKEGIKGIFEVESDLSADETASHLKSIFKATPDGKVLYFSIQPASFFQK